MKMGLENGDYKSYVVSCEQFYLELCKQAKMRILGKSLKAINNQLTEFDNIFGKKFLLTSAQCTVEAVGLLLMALEDRDYDRATDVIQQLYQYYISLLID